MLTLYTSTGEVHQAPADPVIVALMPDAVWVDLLQPSTGETAVVERATGLHLPTLEEISEIESSSRLRAEHGVLYLSAPLVHRATAGEPQTTPVGFVLAADRRVILRRVGASGDLASKIRDGLLGLARMVPYVESLGAAWLPEAVKPRFETMRHDIASLSDYDAHLVNKVQLLLDATLGLINVEQNDIIKVLTIVSVVGVPPTLVASMYGMNFKYMPELSWDWGYPYGLALIAISAVAPLLWFKWRGWF